MWKETKVVKNVEYYNFDARFGVYATTDRGDKSILHIGDKEIALNKVLSVRSYGDKELVLVRDGSGGYDSMLYTKEGKLLNVVNNTIPSSYNTNLRYLNVFMLGGDDYDGCYNLVDIETGMAIFKEYVHGRELFVFNDMIFSNRDNTIIRYDWDGSIMWQHNYEPDFNVKINLGFVMEGVCGGKLWVKSELDRHEILLAIDVKTSELVKAFSDFDEDTNLPHCNLGRISGVHLNCKNDQILLSASEDHKPYMIILNAKTLEVVEKNERTINFDYLEGEEYGFRISEFYGDYITVKMGTYNSDVCNNSGFAVYNYKTKEVVLAHRLFTPEQSQDGLGISPLSPLHYSPTNSKILVHDRWNTLHIFEDVKE